MAHSQRQRTPAKKRNTKPVAWYYYRYYNKYLRRGIITNKRYLKERKHYDKSKSTDKYENKMKKTTFAVPLLLKK